MSELRTKLTYECFYNNFTEFLAQADKNVLTKKSGGGKSPAGITGEKRNGKVIVDGGELGLQYGQGNASKAPYFNWHVLSIYYIPTQQKIVLGVETIRYWKFKELKPYACTEIPPNRRVAVFDEYCKSEIDYEKLYDNFIRISEEIMKLGM